MLEAVFAPGGAAGAGQRTGSCCLVDSSRWANAPGAAPGVRSAWRSVGNHQVMLVCPWLPGRAAPPGESRRNRPTRATHRGNHLRARWSPLPPGPYETVRHDFGRLGVSVVTALQKDSIQLILDRMDQLPRRRYSPAIGKKQPQRTQRTQRKKEEMN